MMMASHKQPERHGEQAFDWDTTHRQLAAAREALARSWEPTPEQTRAILRQRAQELAREPVGESSVPTRRVLLFRLERETYGVETEFVQEVYTLQNMTPVPGALPFLRGITSVRGQIISMIDLKRFLGLPEVKPGPQNQAVIIHQGSTVVGLLADAVLDIRIVREPDLQPPPQNLAGRATRYVQAITAAGLILLNVDSLLTDERLGGQEPPNRTD